MYLAIIIAISIKDKVYYPQFKVLKIMGRTGQGSMKRRKSFFKEKTAEALALAAKQKNCDVIGAEQNQCSQRQRWKTEKMVQMRMILKQCFRKGRDWGTGTVAWARGTPPCRLLCRRATGKIGEAFLRAGAVKMNATELLCERSKNGKLEPDGQSNPPRHYVVVIKPHTPDDDEEGEQALTPSRTRTHDSYRNCESKGRGKGKRGGKKN